MLYYFIEFIIKANSNKIFGSSYGLPMSTTISCTVVDKNCITIFCPIIMLSMRLPYSVPCIHTIRLKTTSIIFEYNF